MPNEDALTDKRFGVYKFPQWRRAVAAMFLLAILGSTERVAGATNNCANGSAVSDFKAGLRKLSETVTERTDVNSEFIEKHFAGCTLENSQELLVKSGFDAGELDPASNNAEKKLGTRRLVLAEKNIRPLSLLTMRASLNCRFILRLDQSNALRVNGFFYLDGP